MNFPGKTEEEALTFCKSIFRGAFLRGALQWFGDVPATEGQPPLSAEDKKLVLHAELAIPGGRIIMATDVLESMVFTVTPGNNIHINLESDTRKETKRLFVMRCPNMEK